MAANNSKKTILVTGATGKQGGAVLKHLREKGFTVRALTRDAQKPQVREMTGPGVSVVQGDQGDRASLERAMEGADGVFSVQDWTGGLEAEVQQGKNVIDAANRQDIAHFVYSSVGSADQNTGIPHFESKAQIEEHLRNSGLTYTIFRPVFFMENWLGSKQQIEGGTLALPLTPDTHLQMIAVDDIGAFVAQAFEHPKRWQGKAIDIAGDDLTMQDLASRFSTAVSKDVQYQQVPWDQFEKQTGNERAVMFRWFQDKGFSADISSLRNDLHSLTPFERWLNTRWREAEAGGKQGGKRVGASS